MSRTTLILLVGAGVLFVVGYIVVFASGHGGNSTGGSEIVWRIGGLMVYAAFVVLLLAPLIHVTRLVFAAAR